MRGIVAIALSVVVATTSSLVGCGLDRSGLEAPGRDAGGVDGAATTTPVDATVPEASTTMDASSPEAASSDDATSTNDTGAADASDGAADAACPSPDPDASVTVVTKITPAPTIDGNLSDWGCIGWTALNDKNAAYVLENGQKISGTYAVRWDPMNIYVAAHIVVPTLMGTNATEPYVNDAIELYLTGDNPPTGDYDMQSHQYVVDWHDTIVDYDYGLNPSSKTNPPHVNAKTLVVSDGWQIEAAVGWQALLMGGGPGFASGNTIALDIAFDDGDGTTLKTQLMAMIAPHSSACGCTNCCCGGGPNPDMPNCDTLCFGSVTLQ
jgi:hypothetical protein